MTAVWRFPAITTSWVAAPIAVAVKMTGVELPGEESASNETLAHTVWVRPTTPRVHVADALPVGSV